VSAPTSHARFRSSSVQPLPTDIEKWHRTDARSTTGKVGAPVTMSNRQLEARCGRRSPISVTSEVAHDIKREIAAIHQCLCIAPDYTDSVVNEGSLSAKSRAGFTGPTRLDGQSSNRSRRPGRRWLGTNDLQPNALPSMVALETLPSRNQQKRCQASAGPFRFCTLRPPRNFSHARYSPSHVETGLGQASASFLPCC
jgi:hypothetical protein